MQTPHTQTNNFDGLNSPQSSYAVSVESRDFQPRNSEGAGLSSQEVAVASGGLLLLFTIWYFVRHNLRRRKVENGELNAAENSLSRARKLTHSLPCTNCHYFKANMYLPCAVNPTMALRPEAKDCQDFQPRNGSERTEVVG